MRPRQASRCDARHRHPSEWQVRPAESPGIGPVTMEFPARDRAAPARMQRIGAAPMPATRLKGRVTRAGSALLPESAAPTAELRQASDPPLIHLSNGCRGSPCQAASCRAIRPASAETVSVILASDTSAHRRSGARASRPSCRLRVSAAASRPRPPPCEPADRPEHARRPCPPPLHRPSAAPARYPDGRSRDGHRRRRRRGRASGRPR